MEAIKVKQTHSLKMLPEFFEACAKKGRNFDIRNNDRGFKVGDKILIKEHTGKKFTGRQITGQITYITDYEQKDGYVVFSFRRFSLTTEKVD